MGGTNEQDEYNSRKEYENPGPVYQELLDPLQNIWHKIIG
jgi:hypothetical protein